MACCCARAENIAVEMDQLQTDTDLERVKEESTPRKITPSQKLFKAATLNILPRKYYAYEHDEEEYLANYTCCPPPLFIPLISIAEVIVFIVYAVELQKEGIPVTATSGVAMYSPLVYRPSRRYEAWRFLTYMLMHQGYMHIILNMIFQILFGVPLEMVHKWRVAILYLLGVIAGALAHSVTDHGVALVGASGGVYALLGAHIAAVVINWAEMNTNCECQTDNFKGVCRIFLSAPMRLAILLLLVVADTSLAIYRRIVEPQNSTVGISAHIGGFIAGLLLGVRILLNLKEDEWEKRLGWVTLAVCLALFVFACIFNAAYKGYPDTDWSGW